MHPRDLVRLGIAQGNGEKERLRRIGSVLGCQEKGSRLEVCGRGIREPGGVRRRKQKTQLVYIQLDCLFCVCFSQETV